MGEILNRDTIAMYCPVCTTHILMYVSLHFNALLHELESSKIQSES